MSRDVNNVEPKYTIDTTLLNDFEKEYFHSLLDRIEFIGCIVDP